TIDSWLAEPRPRYYDGDKTEIGSLTQRPRQWRTSDCFYAPELHLDGTRRRCRACGARAAHRRGLSVSTISVSNNEESKGMITTTKQELFDLGETEQQERGTGVGRRRFLAGLGAGAVALGAGVALGQEKGPNVTTV